MTARGSRRSPLRAAALALALGCAAPAPRPPAPSGDPRSILDRFCADVDAGRWDDAYPLLSARWRGRETPARLASDLAAAGPVGRDAVRRVRSLLAADAPLATSGDVATLAVGAGRAARVVREPEGWRVDALE